MNVVYKTRWRLIYMDGRQLDESPTGSTILERWPDPVELQLIDLTGAAKLRVPIPPGYKPIFYRPRFIEQDRNGVFGDPQLAATVFGHGREEGSRMNGRLWIWRNGQAVDCPQSYIASGAIELQLQA